MSLGISSYGTTCYAGNIITNKIFVNASTLYNSRTNIIPQLDVLDKIQTGMSFDIISYITRYNNFFNNSFSTLVNYWKNNNSTINPSIIIEFEYLYNGYNNVINAFKQKTNSGINDLDYFYFANYLSDLKQSLDIIKNLPKYLKTSINFVDVFQDPVITYFVQEGDTLETIAQKFYGDSEQFGLIMNYNNFDYIIVNSINWIGMQIYIPAKRTLSKDVNGIIDGLVGQNILGCDINSNFAFINDDIDTVAYQDCFTQSVLNMLTAIPLGSIPEFPMLGDIIPKIIGSDLGSLGFPMIVNEITSNMRLDTTIDTFNINNLTVNEDMILIDFTVKSILGSQYNNVVSVTNNLLT